MAGICVLMAVAWGACAQAEVAKPGPLEGSWEIISIVDNGEVLPARVVFEKFTEDGRITVTGNTVRCKHPVRKDIQQMACVVDPSKTPPAIDLAGAENVNSKGIYSLQGDMLTFCFGSPDVLTRPDKFSAPVGSRKLLIVMHRVPTSEPPAPPVLVQPAVVVAPIPARQPPPPVPVAPSAVPAAAPVITKDKVIGTWGHQDEHKISYNTFNPDGTFTGLVTYKNGFQKIFHVEERRSGTWNLADGVVTLRYTGSTDKKDIGQVFSMRVQRIGDIDMVYRDAQGMEHIEWRVR
ncbi:MAG: TIGR03067 domain-containing protein [Planctomycetota bacterium]